MPTQEENSMAYLYHFQTSARKFALAKEGWPRNGRVRGGYFDGRLGHGEGKRRADP